MNKGKVAQELMKVAKDIEAGWSGSTYEDMDEAIKMLESFERGTRNIKKMMDEGLDDLAYDFKEYGNRTLEGESKKLQRVVGQSFENLIRGIATLRGNAYSAQSLINQLADMIEERQS